MLRKVGSGYGSEKKTFGIHNTAAHHLIYDTLAYCCRLQRGKPGAGSHLGRRNSRKAP
jgi:hypothetical protein